jgi:hypothetical protein
VQEPGHQKRFFSWDHLILEIGQMRKTTAGQWPGTVFSFYASRFAKSACFARRV